MIPQVNNEVKLNGTILSNYLRAIPLSSQYFVQDSNNASKSFCITNQTMSQSTSPYAWGSRFLTLRASYLWRSYTSTLSLSIAAARFTFFKRCADTTWTERPVACSMIFSNRERSCKLKGNGLSETKRHKRNPTLLPHAA